MNLLQRLSIWFKSRRPIPLNQWFFVSFDDVRVLIRANPPGRESWEQEFPWASVQRICFKDEGLWASDGLYIFTSVRPGSYVIPTEASGGTEFLNELIARNLFPSEIAIKAAGSSDGGYYCWPPIDRPRDES